MHAGGIYGFKTQEYDFAGERPGVHGNLWKSLVLGTSWSSIYHANPPKIRRHIDAIQRHLEDLTIPAPRRRGPMLVLGQLDGPRVALDALDPGPGIGRRRRERRRHDAAVSRQLLAARAAAAQPRAG